MNPLIYFTVLLAGLALVVLVWIAVYKWAENGNDN